MYEKMSNSTRNEENVNLNDISFHIHQVEDF